MLKLNQLSSWAVPTVVFVSATLMASACGTSSGGEIDCPTNQNTETTGTGESTGSTMNETSSTGTGMENPVEPTFTPQEVAAKLHGCRKFRYDTIGTMLTERGVDMTNVTVDSSGELYATSLDTFSVPKMDSRRAEKDGHTTASAMRLFDIFVQAAPEIIANIQNPALAPACVLNGQTRPMFAADGSCVEESISCLMGMPATEDHVLLCNLILDKADPLDAEDVTRKQHIAVATILAAAHSCE